MHIDDTQVTADVHYADPKKERYYVRITFEGIGLYINSFSVMPSKRDDLMWVQQPKFRTGSRYMSHAEFDKSSELWQIIEYKAREAVDNYKADNNFNGSSPSKDVVVEDINSDPEVFNKELSDDLDKFLNNNKSPP